MSDLEELNTRDDSRNGNLLTIESLDTFTEGNLSDKVNKLISISEVVVFSKKFCPFSIDVIDLLVSCCSTAYSLIPSTSSWHHLEHTMLTVRSSSSEYTLFEYLQNM